MKEIISNILLVIIGVIISSGCREFFGDRNQPESIVEQQNEPVQIVVTNPLYGSIWKPGEVLKIKWIATSIISIDIQLYKKSAFEFSITENIVNTGSFDWLIPRDINLSNQYLIKIINHNNPDDYQFSERFRIQN